MVVGLGRHVQPSGCVYGEVMESINSSHEDSPQGIDASVSVLIGAGLDEVWAALTTDAGLAGWMGDGAKIDLDAGLIAVPDCSTGIARVGALREVSPGRRLAFTWWPEHLDEDAQDAMLAVTDVAITLTQGDAGTVVTVTETAPAPLRAQATTRSSWNTRLALLVVAVGVMALQVAAP